MKFMDFHEIYRNFMKIHEITTFLSNGGLYAPMVEIIDIPKGILGFFEAPRTGTCIISHNISIFMEIYGSL